MLLGLLCLLVLCAAWLVLRGRASGERGPPAWQSPHGGRAVAGGALLVLASCFPLLVLAPWAQGSSGFFRGDSASHAKVALELARYGLPHGWLESYLGGFPFGHHYPPLGWLLLAAGIRLGLSASAATNGLGFVATLAAPLALYAACVRARAQPSHAACAGAFLALVSPYNPFVGGYEVYFMTGLVSQVVALPLCISFAAAAARAARAEAALLGALAMSAHPQLAGACVVLVALVALVDGARGRRAAVGCGIGAAALTAAALYGQGLQTLRVPFGWPPGFTWRQIGFGTTRLVWWFRDGDLFDQGSQVPALTSLVLAAVLACTLLLRRRAPRALLLLGIGALGLSTCGPTLQALPKFGPLLLEFAQPLRVLALLAPISAALLAVVIEEAAVALRGAALPRRWHLPKLLPWTGVLVSSCLLAMAVPTRVRAAERLRVESAAIAAGGCRNVTGFDRAKLSEWFRSLQGGSLWFEQAEGQALAPCLGFHGLELESAVPIGNTSAVGSHLGVFWLAARQLQPERDGAARRARALGIRHVIRATSAGDSLPADFTRRRVSGQIELLEVSGAQRAHVGCVRERWSGSDRALRERLMRELATARGADQLLDPDRLIELTPAQGDLTVAHVDSECDATGATLHVVAHEPGLLEAVVESTRPVDVAFSATAFPAWRVSVNGAPDILARVIAPGYVYAHVPAGRHRIVAKAGSMPGYGAWLVLAALGVAALAWLDPCHLRAAWQYLRRARG